MVKKVSSCQGCEKPKRHKTRVVNGGLYCHECISSLKTYKCDYCDELVLVGTRCCVCPLCDESAALCYPVNLPNSGDAVADVCEPCFVSGKSNGSIVQCNVTAGWYMDDGDTGCGECQEPCVPRK